MKIKRRNPDYPHPENPMNPQGMFPGDPMGSYTGHPLPPLETPVQDADDL